MDNLGLQELIVILFVVLAPWGRGRWDTQSWISFAVDLGSRHIRCRATTPKS
jgi:hypothetical protein